MTRNHGTIVDHTQPGLDLDNGGRVVVGIAPDGTESFWILVPGATGGGYNVPRHERLGKLPQDILELVRPRCGAPRTNGHSCRSAVGLHGDRCQWHPQEVAA